MKCTIKETKSGTPSYPFVGKSTDNDRIILFHSYGKGIVLVKGGGSHQSGHYSMFWEMGFYLPLEGRIILENGK